MIYTLSLVAIATPIPSRSNDGVKIFFLCQRYSSIHRLSIGKSPVLYSNHTMESHCNTLPNHTDCSGKYFLQVRRYNMNHSLYDRDILADYLGLSDLILEDSHVQNNYFVPCPDYVLWLLQLMRNRNLLMKDPDCFFV